MKNFYVLKYESQNLGDDIQSLAVSDILEDLNIYYKYIDRDLINGNFFDPKHENYLILNGWFTNGNGVEEYYLYNKDKSIDVQIPIKGNFIPIIYSFHISEWGPFNDREVHPNFLNNESINFYKSGSPVGCRDSHTYNLMQKMKVESFISGCITLTLNKNKYKKVNFDSNNIVFVDIEDNIRPKILNKLQKTYHSNRVKNLTHSISNESKNLINRFELAKNHLMLFANSNLVITNRLHVLLPCLAFNTPVLFLVKDEDIDNSRIKDYLIHCNYIKYSEIDSLEINENIKNKFDMQNSINIKNKFIEIIKSKL